MAIQLFTLRTNLSIKAMNKYLLHCLASLLGFVSIASADSLPEELRSRHFKVMNQHLDLGGILYAYVDIDGDAEKLVQMGQGFFDFARKADPQEFPIEMNFNRILKATGLDGIKGIGVSSYKNGSRFHNKLFVLAPGERRGLLKIGGGQPHAFKTWDFAPVGSDLVIEQDLDAKAVYEMALDIAGIVMGDAGKGMIQGQVKQPIPEMGFTFEKVINDLDLNLSVVIDMQNNRELTIPDSPGGGINIPMTDAIVKIDKLGWLIDHLAPLAKEEPALRVFRDLQWEGIEVIEEGPGDFNVYKPALLKHLRTGSLVLTTRREFAELCFSEKQSLAEDPKFQVAMKGLPKKGNGFVYLSTTLHETIEKFFKQIPAEEMGGMESSMVMSLISLFVPGADGPEASVSANLPEGFITMANSGSSLKGGFASGALLGPMLIGYGTMMPMMFLGEDFEAVPAELIEEGGAPEIFFEDTPDTEVEEIDRLLRDLEVPDIDKPIQPRLQLRKKKVVDGD
jgi:hypothetical protein